MNSETRKGDVRPRTFPAFSEVGLGPRSNSPDMPNLGASSLRHVSGVLPWLDCGKAQRMQVYAYANPAPRPFFVQSRAAADGAGSKPRHHCTAVSVRHAHRPAVRHDTACLYPP